MSFRHDVRGTPASAWADAVASRPVPPLIIDPAVRRVVVVAAHPDDETLGAGGLVAHAHDAGLEVVVVGATRGEGSHPRSTSHPPDRLARLREAELRAATAVLAPGATTEVLGLRDGALAEAADDLVEHLVRRLGDGRDALVVAPWRGDGHPDHEAAGRAAATAAHRTGAALVEYPVWFWHWGAPDALPWSAAYRLDLDDDQRRRKADAVRCHRSQVEALSEAPGDEVLLHPWLLEHFATGYELVWRLRPEDGALDRLHVEHDDPWGVDRRWYEERKRRLVLAMLLRERFRRAVEVGCSTGALAADLAARCEHLTAVDSSAAAVERARERLAGHPGVEVRHEDVTTWWPDETLDLVVLSEVAYFLSPVALDALVERVRSSLAEDGVVVLCHWRHPVRGWPLDGPEAHRRLVGAGLRPLAARYRDRDVEVLVLGEDQLPSPHA